MLAPRTVFIAAITAALLAITAWGAARALGLGRADGIPIPPQPTPQLEVRWHAGQIVLSGDLPDEPTAALLRAAALRRTGDSEQVNDQTVLVPGAPALRHADRVAALLLLGADGWVLRWSPGVAVLYGDAASDAAVAEAGVALQAAFAPDAAHNRLTVRH